MGLFGSLFGGKPKADKCEGNCRHLLGRCLNRALTLGITLENLHMPNLSPECYPDIGASGNDRAEILKLLAALSRECRGVQTELLAYGGIDMARVRDDGAFTRTVVGFVDAHPTDPASCVLLPIEDYLCEMATVATLVACRKRDPLAFGIAGMGHSQNLQGPAWLGDIGERASRHGAAIRVQSVGLANRLLEVLESPTRFVVDIDDEGHAVDWHAEG